MYLFIRHAEKSHRNGHPSQQGQYGYDPVITPEGMVRAQQLGRRLVQKYGKPTRVVLSPYLRTRQTVFAMLSSLPKDEWPPLEVDVAISEYLGNHRHRPIDLDPQTYYYRPPLLETFDELRHRVKMFVTQLPKYNGCVWFITHGLIIKLINETMGNQQPMKKVGYLEGFALENNHLRG